MAHVYPPSPSRPPATAGPPGPMRSTSRANPLPRGFWPVVAALALALIGLHGVAFGVARPGLWLPAFAVALAGVAALVVLLPRHYPHAAFGAANGVTLTRAMLGVFLLTPLLMVPMPEDAAGGPLLSGQAGPWLVAGVASLALALDGVDGWLARHSGLQSAFGARFDMEVDAAFGLVLALHALAVGAPLLVLFLGLARYGFVAAAVLAPWLMAPLPDSFRRKVVCVVQIAALIVLQLPVLPASLMLPVTLLASAALAASFGRDTLWLARHRG